MSESRAFEADVYIRHVPTGEVRICRGEELVDSELGWTPFIWLDGNFSCDCNRRLFFERAGGIDRGDPSTSPCGDGEYEIDKIVRVSSGELLYATN